MKKFVYSRMIVVLIALVGAGGWFWRGQHAGTAPIGRFRTVPVQKGDLLLSISATGTVEPEEVVDVGAQVAGLILEFGTDPQDPTASIDYGSVVEKDTVLARIDPIFYQASLDQAEATLERAQSEVLQMEARYEQTNQEWQRAQRLRPDLVTAEASNGLPSVSSTASEPDPANPIRRTISESDFITARANLLSARANVAVGKAAIRQNEAALRMAKTNLGYTTIKSPVRGVIIDRRVNMGQTVVASLNAPSLFLIAKDLRRMQIWSSVNEADIGQIQKGMKTRFTVDAYPRETFEGRVKQIRLNAQMTQNVVTYTVVIETDNSDGKLLPYLTASLRFEVEHRSGVLVVPNAVLRWKPQASHVDPTIGSIPALPGESESDELRGRVWVRTEAGFVRPLDVVVGISDGLQTEISGPGVEEGLQIVAAEEGPEAEAAREPEDEEKSGSPFLPKPPKGLKPPPGPM